MSAPAVDRVTPFGFLPAGSSVRRWLDGVLDGLDDRLAALPPGRLEVVSELRCRRTGTGWAPERLYCSLQVLTDLAGPAFVAETLHWSSGGGPHWSRFPADPRLDALGAALRAAPGPDRPEVLRYVPLRRATFRAATTVVKVKRRSRLADSVSRVAALAAAAAGSPVRVPALRRTDPVLSSYSQEAVGGAALSDLAHGPALEPLLAEAGRVHAEVHTLAAEGLPAGDDPADLARGLAEPVGWVAACAPAHADDLRRHLRTLVRLAPVPTAPVTCHGDLVPSHLIGGPGDWAVIDLDLAHRGDPDRDLALFLAGLPTDVPALAADRAPASRRRAAEEAYLAGYEDRTGRRVDRRRLAWHRAAASLHHVGLSATKDRWSPTGLAEAVARVGQLLEEAA